jgi:hypothetical protein
MARTPLLALALLSAASAQQPEQAHIAFTGRVGELSLDFMVHTGNCSEPLGVQLADSADFSVKDFVPAYACDVFGPNQVSTLTLAVRVLLQNLTAGKTYFYVAGSLNRTPWSRVYSFTYGTGLQRPEGYTYAILADFGYYNAESLEKLYADSFTGRFDALLHAGDFAYDFDADVGRVGDGYMRQLEPVISARPYNGIPGSSYIARVQRPTN